MPASLRVILDHDGGVDDLAAQVVLGAARHYRVATLDAAASSGLSESERAALAERLPIVDLVGVIAIDADCFVDAGVSCSLKTAALCRMGAVEAAVGHADPVQIGRSSLTCPGPEPFPADWRIDCVVMDNLPCLNSKPVLDGIASKQHAVVRTDLPGEELLAELVMKHDGLTTICVTGPLSNVAYCLKKYGAAFGEKIDRIVIMGGAFDVQGNVFREGRDGSAEWNIYWDPEAAREVCETPHLKPSQRVFFALDATNDVPVSVEFVTRFGNVKTADGSRHCELSHFLGNSWSMCTGFSRLFGEAAGYYAWDALTAAYVVTPDVCGGVRELRVIVDTDPASPSCGRTRPATAEEVAEGTKGGVVTAAVGTKAEHFYQLMLECAGAI